MSDLIEIILKLDPDEGLSPGALWGLQELARHAQQPDPLARALAEAAKKTLRNIDFRELGLIGLEDEIRRALDAWNAREKAGEK